MAKTKHAQSFNNVHPSPSTRHHVPRTRSPSKALLSALALVATIPPVVAGAPTAPPAFLCPFIERDRIPLPPDSSPPTPSFKPAKCDVVADKYVQGSDSLWRKTDAWTLYGSTCWSGLTDSASAIESQPQTSIPISTPNFDTSVLPAGWNNASTLKSNTESTIILALAIILAGFICVFMIGCVIWRRRKKRARDIERKLGHKRGTRDNPQANEREKDVRGKMRVWAKATARWKSNIRQSARRRRKGHSLSSTANRPPSPTLSDSPQLSLVPSAPSRRCSIASEEPDHSRPETDLSLNDSVTGRPAVFHDPPRSASPPTYGTSFSRSSPSPNPTPSPVGPYSVQRSNQPSFVAYIPPSDGHVATDDKSRLAHIRALASSPPVTLDAASAGTMQSVSAPEWHEVEDDLEDMGIASSEMPTLFHNLEMTPSFPPPPSKADVHSPFDYLNHHPLCYGRIDDILVSPPVPSGPSLGTFPSAPPDDDPGLEPSAPSLEGEDELFQDWDGASSYVPEIPTSADSDPATTCAIEPSIPSSLSSSTHTSFPSILESATRDGTLPRYHP